MKELQDYVRTIPDFPEKGIMFRDITSVLQDPDGFKLAIDEMSNLVKDLDFDVVLGAESRGFIFGCPVAYELGIGFVPARKPNKLPREVISYEYALEYGTSTMEMHKDAIKPGQKVLVVDDRARVGGKLFEARTREGDRVGDDGALRLEGVEHHQREGEQDVGGEENRDDHQRDHTGRLHFHYISTSLLLEIRTWISETQARMMKNRMALAWA